MLRAATNRGALPQAAYQRELERLLARLAPALAAAGADGSQLELAWVAGNSFVETPDEARRALAELERVPSLSAAEGLRALQPQRAALIGGVYAHAGEPARAVPYLRRAAGTCYPLNGVAVVMQAKLLLADTLAATGGLDEARLLYTSIVDRWGTATPRSVTAEKARAALRSLPR
jgi:hypothetical protein